MSSSTDSLKKKVCVTVFLDELFEEVIEDDRQDSQVQEVAGPQVEIIETDNEPSPFVLDNDVNTVAEQAERVQHRPRKHRKESKFSEKVSDLFKRELTKYGCDPCVKTNSESVDCGDSAISDSDIDLDEILKLDHWALENSKTSMTSDMTDDSFMSINPLKLPTKAQVVEEDTKTYLVSKSSSSVKFRQSTSTESKVIKTADNLENSSSKILNWEKAQKEIQLILENSQGNTLDVGGDTTRKYNLKSILEECLKNSMTPKLNGGSKTVWTDKEESDLQDMTDSYTCVFPHKQRKIKIGKTPEIKKVWINSKRNVWNDGFESEVEQETIRPVWKESLICYNLSLKQNETLEEIKEENQSSKSSENLFNEIMDQEEHEIVFKTITKLANKSVLDEIFRRSHREDEIRNEGDIRLGNQESFPFVEYRNKNFAEGDFSEKLLKQESKPELTKRVPRVESNPDTDKFPENLKREKDMSSPSSKEKLMTFVEKNMTDAESETVFAESENSFEGNEDFERPPPIRLEEDGDLVLEFEDKISQSRMLRRIKTVEILGDSSLKSMRNISAEVILICENISNGNICLEAWQSATKMTDIGQVYLKDSNNSAMYLLEIPMHFSMPKKEESYEKCCKATDTE